MAEDSPMPDSNGADAEFWVVPRPAEVLNRLSVPMKWEFTRRHPYYQQFWKLVADDARESNSDAAARAQAAAARELLYLIGVTDVPHPPGTPFAELGGADLGRVWESGAVAPAMFRTLVAVLLIGLPPEVCVRVGRELQDYGGQVAGTTEERQYAALRSLQDLARAFPVLNSFPDAPFVSVNTNAPARAIEEALRALVARFKALRNVPETRRRDDNLDDYLVVWDRREGWVVDRYECSREQTLADIASAVGLPIRTVQNRYRSAFRLLVGHEYTPEIWETVMGRFKWSLLTAGLPTPSVSARRPRRTRQRRPVPETTLAGPADGEGQPAFILAPAVHWDPVASALWDDIVHLIAIGRTNAEICAELDLKDDQFEDALTHIRDRRFEIA